ncbi:MAG: ATP-binding protein [Cyanobacteria bacterium J06614_10]
MTSQDVSFRGYQRLKDSLMQQGGLFESVLTEDQWFASQSSSGFASLAQDGAQQLLHFVLMRSPSLSVLLMAVPLNDSPSDSPIQSSQRSGQRTAGRLSSGSFSHANSAHSVAAQSFISGEAAPIYRVSLTLDDATISDFIDRLESGALASELTEEAAVKDYPNYQTGRNNASQDKSSPDNASEASRAAPTKEGSTKKGEINREAFMLAWAKDLAASPEGDTQASATPTKATLDNQIQRSLLLNQVITRIRHSLDLSDILETTVAQVRAFLSADRLVLYQLGHAEGADLSASLEAQRQNEPGLSDLNLAGGTVIGRSLRSGHVTYESRASENIPSVLNFSEQSCFRAAAAIRDRYLIGEPIAIDDVEQHYAKVNCLVDFLRQAQVKSKLIAPIVVQGQLWGLLIAHQCAAQRHWEETEVIFLRHIAEHLAVAIRQSALYQKLQRQTASLESCVLERTQNLHDALMAAESANLTKGEFLSTMSHELRTPLTYIIGMSATLLRWSFGELSDRQRSYLTTINHSGEQLLNIINDILEFAKIESGRSLLDFGEFSLARLADTVVANYRPLAEKKGVKLSLLFEVRTTDDSFSADAKRLEQILSNLMHNAIKFTPAGGKVTLRVWQEAQITIFQVKDTGIGIPDSQRDQLFEKFKQLESPFQRQYSGTGLGLAMTKRLVELHGGSIQVESRVGEGSTFSVRLPSQTAVLANPRYHMPSTLSANDKRVLLVEREENSAAIVCDLLTADGYEVIWLVETDQLLSQLESLRPVMLAADLSLLSHDVADIKSIQLSITAIGAKVLALLGQSGSPSSHIAHHDTLEKPIDPKLLLEKVRELTVESPQLR